MLDHLEDNIRRVIADIPPQMLEKVIENWTSRLDYIRASCSSHMPDIIFRMRYVGERCLPDNVIEPYSDLTLGVKVWGAISHHGLTNLLRIEGNLNSNRTFMASSDVVQSGHPIFDDFFQHLWPYIGNNTANVVFQMVKRLWLIRIDQLIYIAPQKIV
ncbi:hypothetical protein TNCV_3442191 [Trichonephila clavipes]|nr:hypothetical protein TNCV_3442191 [Trichonephila clavipes]